MLRTGIALLLFAFASSLQAANVEVRWIEMTVSDLDRAHRFYTGLLEFSEVSTSQEPARDTMTLRLGEETLVLARPRTPGQPVPAAMASNDRLFQHVAIVVSDIDAAYARLVRAGVTRVSSGPQTLPDSNYDAAGIRALYFRDPDGHFLELIQLPPAKGEPKWQRRDDGRLFLGIDHTAIVVRDLRASRHFYRDVLGFTLVGSSLNFGPEQDALNRLRGSRVEINSFRGAKGPGIELLHYLRPGTADTFKGLPQENDLLRWRIRLSAAAGSDLNTGRTRVDPDGHALQFDAPDADHRALDHMIEALRQHWPRYLMEGAQLGLFMIVTLYLTLALEHPASPIRRRIASSVLRRIIMGACIGSTVIVLIYSDWGRQSGAQFNPAVTLAMFSLDRIEPWDAVFYVLSQFVGGWLGLTLASLPVRTLAAHRDVNFVVTPPGPQGKGPAFLAEFLISFLILFSLLQVMHRPEWKHLIGVVAGLHLWAFIALEAPYSGMSLNPARTMASAIAARNFQALWIYFLAPPMAMLFAAQLCRRWIDS